MALGAQRADVLRLIVGQGFILAVAGVALGLAGAYGLTRYLKSLLFHVNAVDAGTFAVVSVLLILVAVCAAYIPARRATQIDPMLALRYE
jgi:putative ABC transport system permease protein